MPESLSRRLAEFKAHVWDHNQDLFQQSFDLRAPLAVGIVNHLQGVVSLLSDGADDDALANLLQDQLKGDPYYIFAILQMVGLTREKLRTDVKPALTQLGLSTPSKVTNFANRQSAWDIAGPYLAKRIRTVFANFLGLDFAQLASALEALNQATWPGYIRQERAKRSGGEAEQRLAILLRQLRLPFVPEGKADNGLTKDVTYAGESFDIIVPNLDNPELCVIAMVHAANIGQYGESKAGDAARAKSALEAGAKRPLLGVLADGVGFDSNRAGLEGLLTHADEFFQLKTLWKAAVIAAHATGHHLVLVLPDENGHKAFLDRYQSAVTLRDKTDGKAGWVAGGEGAIRPA